LLKKYSAPGSLLKFIPVSLRVQLKCERPLDVTPKVRAGQLQRTVGPHKSLRIRLRAASVCTYLEKWREDELTGRPFIYKQ
jgi:hypothetical protein